MEIHSRTADVVRMVVGEPGQRQDGDMHLRHRSKDICPSMPRASRISMPEVPPESRKARNRAFVDGSLAALNMHSRVPSIVTSRPTYAWRLGRTAV